MKRCKFLTLMFALLLLQSSVLAANTDTTVTVTLPTFAVTLNDAKIDSGDSFCQGRLSLISFRIS